MGLGARLKKSREEAGLSPAIAAESLGISIERLVSWELEKEEPTARELAEAARLYPVSADILLAVEESGLTAQQQEILFGLALELQRINKENHIKEPAANR